MTVCRERQRRSPRRLRLRHPRPAAQRPFMVSIRFYPSNRVGFFRKHIRASEHRARPQRRRPLPRRRTATATWQRWQHGDSQRVRVDSVDICVFTLSFFLGIQNSACQEVDDRPERVEVVQPFAIVLPSATSGIAGVRWTSLDSTKHALRMTELVVSGSNLLACPSKPRRGRRSRSKSRRNRSIAASIAVFPTGFPCFLQDRLSLNTSV